MQCNANSATKGNWLTGMYKLFEWRIAQNKQKAHFSKSHQWLKKNCTSGFKTKTTYAHWRKNIQFWLVRKSYSEIPSCWCYVQTPCFCTGGNDPSPHKVMRCILGLYIVNVYWSRTNNRNLTIFVFWIRVLIGCQLSFPFTTQIWHFCTKSTSRGFKRLQQKIKLPPVGSEQTISTIEWESF